MSRIGKEVITVPDGVVVDIDKSNITVSGKLGKLTHILFPEIKVMSDDGKITLDMHNYEANKSDKKICAKWGLLRSNINNLVIGVSEGFSTNIELVGVGYRGIIRGKVLYLSLGYSHDIAYVIPEDIAIKCITQTIIEIKGINKQHVGQVVAKLKSFRKIEPYKGKGVRIQGQYVRIKAGKSAK